MPLFQSGHLSSTLSTRTNKNMLQDIVKIARFVTLAKDKNGFIVEANCWIDDRTFDPPYTVNIRGCGKTVESATENCLDRMKLCGVKSLQKYAPIVKRI